MERKYDIDPVLEIELDDEKIEEFIDKLNELKETKTHIHFGLDDEHEILIHHTEDEMK